MPDAQDKCPNEAEDVDQFEDEDGCPEGDNDKDGIPDLNDACPNAAEDGTGQAAEGRLPVDHRGQPTATASTTPSTSASTSPRTSDNFQDDDGCPDPDNDADGIPDDFDTCPNDAEDPDGFEDEDGCPDPDNDKDGFLDAADRCPTAGRDAQRQQGRRRLPGSGRRGRAAGQDRIELDERIGFGSRGGKLQVQGELGEVRSTWWR